MITHCSPSRSLLPPPQHNFDSTNSRGGNPEFKGTRLPPTSPHLLLVATSLRNLLIVVDPVDFCGVFFLLLLLGLGREIQANQICHVQVRLAGFVCIRGATSESDCLPEPTVPGSAGTASRDTLSPNEKLQSPADGQRKKKKIIKFHKRHFSRRRAVPLAPTAPSCAAVPLTLPLVSNTKLLQSKSATGSADAIWSSH